MKAVLRPKGEQQLARWPLTPAPLPAPLPQLGGLFRPPPLGRSAELIAFWVSGTDRDPHWRGSDVPHLAVPVEGSRGVGGQNTAQRDPPA